MSVRGFLKTMAIEDVFDWIDRRGLVGELTLDRANVTRRFQLAKGPVTGPSSTDPTEYLGQILINAGHLTEDKLRDPYATREARKDKGPNAYPVHSPDYNRWWLVL